MKLSKYIYKKTWKELEEEYDLSSYEAQFLADEFCRSKQIIEECRKIIEAEGIEVGKDEAPYQRPALSARNKQITIVTDLYEKLEKFKLSNDTSVKELINLEEDDGMAN